MPCIQIKTNVEAAKETAELRSAVLRLAYTIFRRGCGSAASLRSAK